MNTILTIVLAFAVVPVTIYMVSEAIKYLKGE